MMAGSPEMSALLSSVGVAATPYIENHPMPVAIEIDPVLAGLRIQLRGPNADAIDRERAQVKQAPDELMPEPKILHMQSGVNRQGALLRRALIWRNTPV